MTYMDLFGYGVRPHDIYEREWIWVRSLPMYEYELGHGLFVYWLGHDLYGVSHDLYGWIWVG